MLSQDELSTTQRSYEEQLASMTEHMSEMNRKLIEQTDQLTVMRYNSKENTSESTSKGNRRSLMLFK